MKRTTIAMIIIAIAGLLVCMALVFAEIYNAKKSEHKYISSSGQISSLELPSCGTIEFDNDWQIFFNDNFPGLGVTVDPSVVTPKLTAPADFMPFINLREHNDTLSISIRSNNETAPENRITNFYNLNSSQPIALILPSAPKNITNNCNLSLKLNKFVESTPIAVKAKRSLLLDSCRIGQMEVNGSVITYRDEFALSVCGGSVIEALTVVEMQTCLALESDSTAAEIGEITWQATSKNHIHKLKTGNTKIGKFEFVPCEGSNIEISSPATLQITFQK